jgi:hypothetical protein
MRILPAVVPFLMLVALPLEAASAAATPADCRYDVTIEGAEAKALDVAIRCTTAGLSGFRLTESEGIPWVKDFRLDGAASTADGDGAWRLPKPSDGPIAASYRVDLDGFAGADDSLNGAKRIGASVVTGLADWMVTPLADRNLSIALSVAPSGGFASALPMIDGAYRIDSRDLPDAGNTAFGRRAGETVRLPAVNGAAAELAVTVLDGTMKASPAELAQWVRDTGLAVAGYWGGFPVERASIILVPVAGKHGLPFGRVIAVGGASVLILVGAESKARELYDEWVLVHEFTHLGSPYIRDTGAWLNAGLATYLEPIVRARAGWRSVASVWQEWLQNMPRGLDTMGKTGLVHAGRGGIYWGGALFMLQADIAIRQASRNRLGLEDCVGAVLRQGGDVRTTWKTADMLKACDAAVGGRPLEDIADDHLDHGKPVDLPALWKALGVALAPDGTVVTDDAAPLADVRRAIIDGGPANRMKPIAIAAP